MQVEVIGPANEDTARGDQVLVKRGDEYFVVSSVDTSTMIPPGLGEFGGFETLVFPADAEGNVTDWGEVAGGRGVSRDEAIEELANAEVEA